jgi:spore coat protein U-like protein
MKPLAVGLALTLTALAPGAAVASTCTVIATGTVAFGAYDVFDAAPVHSSGSITYHCTSVLPVDTVRIELAGDETMTSGTEHLGYGLYLDASRTIRFGDGTGGTSAYGPVTPPDDTDVVVTVYGRIPARQDVPAGAYADTVTVTIVF